VRGIGVSPGIAIGKVLKREEQSLTIERKHIDDTVLELERFATARAASVEEIGILYDHAIENIGLEEAQIFEAHKMMIDDPEYIEAIELQIENENRNAEWAVKEVTDELIQLFENMDNKYMRERAADLRDVSSRMIKEILGVEIKTFSNLKESVIIVEHDLTPSDTAQMDRSNVLGFITEIGGRTSHSAIMARTLEIPAVVGVAGITDAVRTGDVVVFDGDRGCLHINPDHDVLKWYENEKALYEESQNQMRTMIGKESISKDGIQVELAANIGTPEDVNGVLRNDAEGIGLYRTEFLYMGRDQLPSEEEQFKSYSEVALRMNNKPVVIRTLDIGGDKELSYMELAKEMNPFLGYRAIRICLDRIDIFRTQLRALLRASAFGNIKIMFPMISCVEELRKAKQILEDVMEELRDAKIDFDETIEVGIMIEIPAAAIISDLLAEEVDFFSIGTNDLIQYTTAVDRMNSQISELYTPYHPALLRLVKMVIENGREAGIWVGMCGEVAGNPKLIPILLGMGLNEFSMSPIAILKARSIITSLSCEEMRLHAERVINMATASEVEAYLDEKIKITI